MSQKKLLSVLAAFLLGIAIATPRQSSAGTPAQNMIDVSPNVSTSPVPFVPGGNGVLTLTINNAGPDEAVNSDTVLLQNAERASERKFTVGSATPGCHAALGFIENDYVQYYYYFPSVPGGESRTCVFNIQFQSSTIHNFPTYWILFPNDGFDTNPSNNRVDYAFLAIGDIPVPLPTASWPLMLLLGAGLIALARATLSSALR